MYVEGHVNPAFEPVRKHFTKMMGSAMERNAQLCIYSGDECVVDLWGSYEHDLDFSPDALINVFSSGKSLESILLGMLAEKRLFSFDDPIASHWPEFAQNGKQALTIADLMRHEGGLASLHHTFTPAELQTEQILENSVGRVLEGHPLFFSAGDAPENRREYHSITRGWIANEIFRRLDPAQRTMGQFIREEVAEKAGLDVFINLHENELHRISPLHSVSMASQLLRWSLPKFCGRAQALSLFHLPKKLWSIRTNLKRIAAQKFPTPIAGFYNGTAFSDHAFATAEIPSAGSKCSARGLAKLGAYLVNGGALAETRLFAEETIDLLHGDPVDRNMSLVDTTFTQSGLAQFRATQPGDEEYRPSMNAGREGFYGWMGYGGSIFQWHPENRIAFAFVPTALNYLDVFNERGKALQRTTIQAVQNA